MKEESGRDPVDLGQAKEEEVGRVSVDLPRRRKQGGATWI